MPSLKKEIKNSKPKHISNYRCKKFHKVLVRTVYLVPLARNKIYRSYLIVGPLTVEAEHSEKAMSMLPSKSCHTASTAIR